MTRTDVEDAAVVTVLGVLGLLNYAWWAIKGRPDWAKARSSYPR